MQPNHHSPDEVMQHGIIFILANTVVSIFSQTTQTVLLEEMVHYCVGPFPSVVYQVVDLPRDGFTTYSEDFTVAWSEEVDGPRLEGIRGVLSHVERVQSPGSRLDEGGRGLNALPCWKICRTFCLVVSHTAQVV